MFLRPAKSGIAPEIEGAAFTLVRVGGTACIVRQGSHQVRHAEFTLDGRLRS